MSVDGKQVEVYTMLSRFLKIIFDATRVWYANAEMQSKRRRKVIKIDANFSVNLHLHFTVIIECFAKTHQAEGEKNATSMRRFNVFICDSSTRCLHCYPHSYHRKTSFFFPSPKPVKAQLNLTSRSLSLLTRRQQQLGYCESFERIIHRPQPAPDRRPVLCSSKSILPDVVDDDDDFSQYSAHIQYVQRCKEYARNLIFVERQRCQITFQASSAAAQ